MTDMTRVIKICDLCAEPLAPDELFANMTISTVKNLTTWDLHDACAEMLNREFERRFQYTRGRRKATKDADSIESSQIQQVSE